MYQTYNIKPSKQNEDNNYIAYYPYISNNQNDERLAGGFVFPFLLGGVTGAAIAPAFWNKGYGNNNGYYFVPAPYPYPYYPPRRWY